MASSEMFKVFVDYDMSLADMIAAGQYCQTSRYIIADNFPILGEGQQAVEPELVHLNKTARTKKVLREVRRRGLRSARIEELLALGAEYPELQKEFPIIALGSVWQPPNEPSAVPFLSCIDHERFLDLNYYDFRVWAPFFRFLAVRK